MGGAPWHRGKLFGTILICAAFAVFLGKAWHSWHSYRLNRPYQIALRNLSVLYLGPRQDDFLPFLRSNFVRADAKDPDTFTPADAASYDVVLLDWPQTGRQGDFPPKVSPLGERGSWHKPTVLLGSAGLNLAVVWNLKGGTGCTCMDPLAYGWREHEIFKHPFEIDFSKTVTISTPPAFRDEITTKKIEVLPLVNDYKRSWRRGWCSYSDSFPSNPDTEYFCGGVNEKTSTAAGLWRQGNLLHFGFEQSPQEMNSTGQKLLLNAIGYISRFSQDQPIAYTPSVFAGPVARSHQGLIHMIHWNYPVGWIEPNFVPEVWQRLAPLNREAMVEWIEGDGRFLHPSDQNLHREAIPLELDRDLISWGTPFQKPSFIDKAILELRAGGERAQIARRLLERYVPCGPSTSSADLWQAWWDENRPYCFASDWSDYRWYIDPLAQARKVPSCQLRGPARSDK